jgi:hypothetical protein
MSGQEVAITEADPKTDALESFERWSNYLLVTTVAAAGWVASDGVTFEPEIFQSVTLGCFGVAIIFGIFTLALVPLIAETMMKSDSSIYRVKVRFSLFTFDWYVYLTQACRPQHASFIAGIAFYCIGTVDDWWPAVAVLIAALLYGWLSQPGPWRRPPWRKTGSKT